MVLLAEKAHALCSRKYTLIIHGIYIFFSMFETTIAARVRVLGVHYYCVSESSITETRVLFVCWFENHTRQYK